MANDEKEEVFLSLEDDAIPQVVPELPADPEPVEEEPEDTSYLLAEVVDTSVLTDASGSYKVSWPLMGMDCPDCASKAMGALRHMKQVTESNVSATTGEVCLLYTSPSPRDLSTSRMPSSA